MNEIGIRTFASVLLAPLAYSFHTSAATLDAESIAFEVEHAKDSLSRTPPNQPVLATTA